MIIETKRLILRPFLESDAADVLEYLSKPARREGLFKEFVSFVNNPDGTPRYENTVQYAILNKEWS